MIQLKIISTSGRKVLNFHKSNFGQVIAKMSRQVAIFLVILSFFKIQKWVSLTAFPQFFFTLSLFAVADEKCKFASGERNMRAHEFCFGRVSVYTVSTSLEKTFACLENSPWDKVLRTVRGWVSCWRCLWPLEKNKII